MDSNYVGILLATPLPILRTLELSQGYTMVSVVGWAQGLLRITWLWGRLYEGYTQDLQVTLCLTVYLPNKGHQDSLDAPPNIRTNVSSIPPTNAQF